MSSRFATIAGALILTALLGGCHSARVLIPPNLRPPSEDSGDALKLARKELQQATPCCSSFADFSYQAMLPWQPEKFTLGNGGMVANMSGTHSYFLAFRLPTGIKLPYRVALKSELSGRWLHSSYLFAPTVVVLDGGFQPIRSADVGLCEHMGWSDETTGAFGSFTIDSKQARYLLVYSSAAQQSGKTYWEQSPAAFSTKATLDMNPTGNFSIAHGPDGVLWVGMMDKTYADAVDNAVCGKAAQGNGVINTLRTALPLPWNSNDNGKKDNSSHPE
jgi:hypothetical protein